MKSTPMTELKVQRAILWLVMAMGIALLPLGIIRPSFWGLTLLGLAMLTGGVLGVRRVNREIKVAIDLQQTVIGETIFRQEIARTGRLDLAQQAIERGKPQRKHHFHFGMKLRA
jgi:hypothetical protein